MKTSLRKLRGFRLHKHDAKERKDLRPLVPQLDELAQASQDMLDMRDCYDSLLSAAAATANSAYEFSESLQEMGACLLQKTVLNDDEESGKVLLMLGKVQFELKKLVDKYRSHIFQTITSPSESLLNELRIVEEMKRQCDEKRDVYEYMRARQKEKGRFRPAKGESFSMQQLQAAHDEYDEEAILFVFRLKSLKQGQSRSLLTQAARHHASQLHFFKKAVKSLEAVEPHVKSVTEQQHIDYQFSGLEDDGIDDVEDDDDSSYDVLDDGELSFDYGQNDQDRDLSTSQHSMEVDRVDITFPQVEAVKENLDKYWRYSFSSSRIRASSQSAPLSAESRSDADEKMRQLRQSSSRKFLTYVLPTPVDTKSSVLTGRTEHKQNMSHSSHLEPKQNEKVENKMLGRIATNAQSILESNNNVASTRLPLPLTDGFLFSPHNHLAGSDTKKVKRQSFSGPLIGKSWPTKPVSVDEQQLFSGPLLGNEKSRSSSQKASPVASPTFVASPKISELHELPRPPTGTTLKSSRPSGLIGHSAPLGSKSQMHSSISNKRVVTSAASPLPRPPLTMPRSFSIPSGGPREKSLDLPKPMEAAQKSEMAEDIASPPLTPIALSNSQPL